MIGVRARLILTKQKIVGKLKNKTERELFEAYCIRVKGEDSCVHLAEKEFSFLCQETEFLYK